MSENKYIENIGCTSCGSNDAVGVYERSNGSRFGKCFKCDTVHTDINQSSSASQQSKKEGVDGVTYYDASYNSLKSRGISKEVCEKYEVKSIVDSEGNDIFHFYPVLNNEGALAVCRREVDTKEFRWIPSQKNLKFFGQDVVGSGGKMIIITEGVCDCLAVVEMLKKQGKNYRTVSINNGASSAKKAFQENFEWLMTFENIFLAFDNDEPGQKAVKEVSELFPPNKVKNITYQNAKDPNELLLSGRSSDFLSAIFAAKESRPDGIVSIDDIFEDAIRPPVIGLSFPWKTLTDATFGYRDGELWGIGAGSGCGKCLAKGTNIRLANGRVIKVEDLRIGSLVLTRDNKTSWVTNLGTGFDEMYEVIQSDNTSYVVNSEHILSVIHNNIEVDINVKDAVGLKLFGYNASIEYYEDTNIPLDPYILGVWLGDGHNNSPSITCGDKEVINEWISYGKKLGLNPTEFTGETNCQRINLSRIVGTRRNNILYDKLKYLNLPFNKHIPSSYLINKKWVRYQVLAGLLDTDGYLNYTGTFYEFSSKYKQLRDDLESLARSLGFRVKSKTKVVNKKEYYLCTIHGNITEIPCRVSRKKAIKNSSNLSKIVSIKSIGLGEYFGFTLSDDRHFCLENYTVTHNTEFFKECINHTINFHHEKAGVIFLEEPASKTVKVLAGKKVNKRFHIPTEKGGDWTIEELVDGINDLKGKVFLYNHFGAKDWESIKPKIRYMVSALGIKRIYLDHLTALVAQEDNEYKALNRLMEEMSSLCEELGCTLFYVSHLRKASGTPHEEGGRVTADQFKGSGAIVFWSHFLIGLERNQQAENEEERNITTLRVLKDRNTGLATGTTFKLKYDHGTGRWGELDEDEFNEEF